jgi:hypothetical protein
MKTPANYRPVPPAPQRWLPADVAPPRALDLSYWLSRAARGHTWNGAAQHKPKGMHA